MKLLHYIPDLSEKMGQQSRMMLRLVTTVSRQAESYLLTSTRLSADVEQQLSQVYSMKIVYLPVLSMSNPTKIYRAYKEIKGALDVIQPDVVHVHGAWNPLLYLMERTARKSGYVTCVSTYGGMAPEILNIDFFKRRMFPLLFYQAPLIRHSTSLLAISEKEWQDISNLRLKKRVEILPEIPRGAGAADALANALLVAYRKAIDSSYKKYITADEELYVERHVIAATTSDAKPVIPSISQDKGTSLRRVLFYAYDEDVIEMIPNRTNVEDIPRYADRKAKKRGGIELLQLPLRKVHIADDKSVEYSVVTTLLRVQKEGIKRLTLRHKAELYDLFRNKDFDEDIVAAELSRLRMRRFTCKIQNMLHDMYDMPVGYDIF